MTDLLHPDRDSLRCDPGGFHIDPWRPVPCALITNAHADHAQPGHGRRANLLTDYTFAVRNGDEFITIAKAYSGLTDAEIRTLDRWIRRNTRERFGPVRAVHPQLVFEIAFEGIQASTRHNSGIALRFPRIARQRPDKAPDEADTLDSLKEILRAAEQTRPIQPQDTGEAT